MPVCGFACWLGWLFAPAVLAAEPLDFAQQIAPLLQAHCVRCHHDGNASGELSLSSRATLLASGHVVAGDVDGSHLLTVVSSVDGQRPMMPETGKPLTEADVRLLRDWVAAGAEWPSDLILRDTQRDQWWALQPLRFEIPPGMHAAGGLSDWDGSPIDRFVLSRLNDQQLRPNPNATPPERLRRLFLLALGVPPSLSEQDAFLHDTRSDAWSRLVERTLSDPRFGERWAQHWLDLVRWAETAGFETNAPRPQAWPYRDWVIRAINDDLPYDQFLRQQLAGDTVNADAALGFLTAGPANLPGQIGEDEASIRQARQDELDEVIQAVSQTFLGLTVGCARCHDHKFDPISQRDYYALQAVFAGMHYGTRRLRGPVNDAWNQRLPHVTQQVERLTAEWQALNQAHRLQPPVADVQTERFEPIETARIRMNIRATTDGSPASVFEFQVWSVGTDAQPTVNVAHVSQGAVAHASSFALENQTRHPENLIDGYLDDLGPGWPWKSKTGGPAWVEIQLPRIVRTDRIVWYRGHGGPPVDYVIQAEDRSGNWTTLVDSRRYQLRLDDRRPAENLELIGVAKADRDNLVRLRNQLSANLAEQARLKQGPQVFAATFAEPEETWLLSRGDPMQRLERVSANVPEVTGSLTIAEDGNETDRRVSLVEQLTRPDHPLTARVIVNRIWQQYFGRGLVATPSDFGRMGQPPSHPELLDWLAAELIRNDWSLKSIHRAILNSNAFQQSSQRRADAMAVDAGTIWLWRFPPRRIEAESIRDSILTVSGKLNQRMYGVGFDFFQQQGGLSDYVSKETFDQDGWRRMIYARKIRMQAVDIFSAFDCPDAGQLMPQRNQSSTPLQALGLMNSPFVIRQAEFFANRLANAADQQSILPDQRIVWQIHKAFRLALTRSPRPEEQDRLIELARRHGMRAVCRVLLNTSEFVTVP